VIDGDQQRAVRTLEIDVVADQLAALLLVLVGDAPGGLFAPAGTPAPVVGTLSKALRGALVDPEFQKIVTSQGAKIVSSSPEEFARFLKAESERLSTVIREANIHSD